MLTKTDANSTLRGPTEITGRTLAHTQYSPAERVELGAKLVSGEVVLVRLTRGQAATLVRAHIDQVADQLKPHRCVRPRVPAAFEAFSPERRRAFFLEEVTASEHHGDDRPGDDHRGHGNGTPASIDAVWFRMSAEERTAFVRDRQHHTWNILETITA
jgi:hypothetical protein